MEDCSVMECLLKSWLVLSKIVLDTYFYQSNGSDRKSIFNSIVFAPIEKHMR